MNAEVRQVHSDILDKTFRTDSEGLPVMKDFIDHVSLDRMQESYNPAKFEERMQKSTDTHEFRRIYCTRSFPILTREWVLEMSAFLLARCQKVVELACGSGWLTYWLRHYGVIIEYAVDDHSWNDPNEDGALQHPDRRFDFQPWVTKKDCVAFVTEAADVDTFILSWPYMNPMAADTWKAMYPGQLLIYIGESRGGCTADDEFFDLVNESEVDESPTSNFLSFDGIHDHVVLYRKR